MMSLSRSGSSRSPRLVDPVTSANSAVTSLRSCAGTAGSLAETAAPQAEQNRASGGRSAPQVAHVGINDDPHRAQNRAPTAFTFPQLGHALTARGV